MKILFAADVSIKNIIGGVERVLYEQTSRLAKRGHKVSIITRKLPAHTTDHELISDVHEFRYHVNRSNSASFLISSVCNSIRLFSRLLKEDSFDLINFHQPFSALSVNLTPKSRSIKKVYQCHSLSFEEYETRNPRPSGILPRMGFRINSYLRKYIEKYSLSQSRFIVVLSEFSKDKLIKHHKMRPDKICIIPGGVDIDRFQFNEDKIKIRKKLGLPDVKFLLFTVRNLVPRMGLENLIYAMKEIADSAKDIYLVIGGEGGLREKLANLISELNLRNSIKLQGFIPHQDLSLFYQAADFFVLPTLWLEGFGLVTVEAMACGTPVLGTPIGGTKEILGKFDPSFLFENTEPGSMAKLILEKYNFYKDKPEEYRKLSQECRNFVEKYYSWERNIDEIVALFTQLIEDQ
jgi:glycosyltransferase involved in cell wall biosynthesis